MNENEAYGEYVTARKKVQAVHDALVAAGKTHAKDRIASKEYRAAVKKEHAAWIRFLVTHDE